jgi:hypothetical protein
MIHARQLMLYQKSDQESALSTVFYGLFHFLPISAINNKKTDNFFSMENYVKLKMKQYKEVIVQNGKKVRKTFFLQHKRSSVKEKEKCTYTV